MHCTNVCVCVGGGDFLTVFTGDLHWFLFWVEYNLSVFVTENEWLTERSFHVIPLEVKQHKNLI